MGLLGRGGGRVVLHDLDLWGVKWGPEGLLYMMQAAELCARAVLIVLGFSPIMLKTCQKRAGVSELVLPCYSRYGCGLR